MRNVNEVERGRGVSLRFAVSLVVALATATPAAAALPPGVHIDPNAPASKEYSIPLGAARGNGAAGGRESQQLFGAGVTNARTAAIGASSSGNPSGRAPHAPSAARGS